MKVAVATGLGFLICAASLYAQESLVGKYTGSYMQTTSQGDRAVGLMLQITGVADGKVKATAVRGVYGNRGPGVTCAGEYQMEGTYKDNEVAIKSVTGPGAGDCTLSLRLVAEGNKLKGKYGERDVELSK